MKVVLLALNGSYSHTNLAIRCLRAPLERAGYDVVLCEHNLHDMTLSILERLVSEKADVYGFSSYIWNITEMLGLAQDLKKLMPSSKTVFGGPEVSFGTERFDYPFIDYIICGEGEDAIVKICNAVRDGEKCERIVQGGRPDVMRDEGILYRDGDFVGGAMLYYESSRGCPYRCSYCLSSASDGVRAKTVAQTLSDLGEFEKAHEKIKIIKFVDRTFNFNVKRANEIWRALLSGKFTKNYHFEVCANLLDDESFEIFSLFPKGKIQLEIGLQSTNSVTLETVSRHLDAKKITKAAERIKKFGNIHVHVDLIAGLPYENYESFKKSFDDAYYCCDMLQLGFLKLLYGTELRRRADEYGIVCMSKAPYTVLKTKWLSFEEILHLQKIADVLDRYRESGGFDSCLEYALDGVDSPFAFYDGLLGYITENDGRSIRRISQNDAYRLLYEYVSVTQPSKEPMFSEKMHSDYSQKEVRKVPLFLKSK